MAEPKTRIRFTEPQYVITLLCVVSLFLFWGIAMTMGDVLNRQFQHVLHLSKSKSALVQFSIFGAYAVMGIPAGLFMRRFGYKFGVILGLCLFASGALLFRPAADAASFTYFRVALFVLACGMATLETVAHPFVSILGSESTSAQRLNFAQGFNGIGGISGGLLGGYFILKAGQQHSDDLHQIKLVYTAIGLVIFTLACFFLFLKIPEEIDSPPDVENDLKSHQTLTLKGLFKNRHFAWAILAQFCNVAAQAGTWAFFIVYGIEIMKFSAEQAAYYFSGSMLLKTIGRFSGALMLRFISPGRLLAVSSVGCISMCFIAAQALGWFSFGALIFLMFFMSIMYPTIYGLGLKGLGEYRQQASSFIVLGVAGGAVFPYLMGKIADTNVAASYYLPIVCYAFVLLFALKLSNPGSDFSDTKIQAGG